MVVLPARLLLDVVRSLPGRPTDARAAQRRAGRRADLRRRHLPPAHAARRGLPARCPTPSPETRIALPAAAFVQTVSRVARSASRDETRPVLTGILMSASGQRAAHGRDRLLPPERQGDGARDAAAERARGEHPRPRAAGARAHRPAGRERVAGRQRRPEPGRLRARRRRAVLAPDRRPVPQLPPAAARSRSSTSCASSTRRAGRRRAPHQPAGAEERAAAPRLQRGRADGLRADAGRRRGHARRSRCRSAASRSRSASTPSSCATGWRASSPTSSCSS